jgi:hydroxymethylglutaryl-CoA lyase
VATERVAAHLAAQGWATGLDAGVMARAAALAQGMRGGADA